MEKTKKEKIYITLVSPGVNGNLATKTVNLLRPFPMHTGLLDNERWTGSADCCYETLENIISHYVRIVAIRSNDPELTEDLTCRRRGRTRPTFYELGFFGNAKKTKK